MTKDASIKVNPTSQSSPESISVCHVLCLLAVMIVLLQVCRSLDHCHDSQEHSYEFMPSVGITTKMEMEISIDKIPTECRSTPILYNSCYAQFSMTFSL